MREKLLQLMKNEGLKPSQLAEMLEINPAGISHILAGRNKPGFDLLQKILRRFPRINPDWLLLDSDKMYRDDTDKHPEPPVAFATDRSLFAETSQPSKLQQNDPLPQTGMQHNGATDAAIPVRPVTGKIDHIVIFYDDHTFESFSPQKR